MFRLPDASRSRAVLIGAAQYAPDSGLESVPAVAHNVEDLRNVLVRGQPGAFAAEHVTVVTDPKDNKELGFPLIAAARAATDVLLVYYSGHGLIGAQSAELFLAMAETDQKYPSVTACSLALIKEAFSDSPARIRVLILDCCFSGRALVGGLAGGPSPIGEQLKTTGAYTLVSSPPNEPSHFEEGKRHTAFTGELLRALRDGFPGAGPDGVTLGALYQHLRDRLREQGKPEPQQSGTNNAADLILSRPRTRRSGVAGRSSGALLPVTDRERLQARGEAGRLVGRNGQAHRAANELGEVVTEMIDLFGADDRDTLAVKIEYAQWMGQSGRPGDALALSAATIGEMSRILGADDRATLVGRAQLAHWTGEVGRPSEARSLAERVVADLGRVFGPEDRETLLGRGQVAHWTGVAGDVAGAAAQTEGLVPDLARVLGGDDRDTLVGRINHAQWTGKAGEVRRAARLFRNLVPDLHWTLGAEDLHTLLGRSRLGQWTGIGGAPKRARLLFEAVVPDLSRVAGRDARETLLARSQHAHWAAESGDVGVAVGLIRDLLDDLAWTLGDQDEVTLVNRVRLAHWTALDGDVRTGVRLYAETLPELRRLLGSDHPEVRSNEALLAEWRRRADRRHTEEIFFGASRPQGRSRLRRPGRRG
ncbi:hypothetical protein DN069_28325 [Streptacidiphilus pinicola]|uniref:Peptidase C14 caspase domain-containing protein n=1 Tax=Streptacidiphilus pinicola TaxID=2219663 RepID=A0A2X0K4X1_9ACTN|nr:caspase family protein [Streptacidiphilus pinicola]RAG82340.1 hypothetical protein DN069_28325 [Streptacidiphilus pinicola]